MREPLISLCMIVRNEEKNLPRCLESVRGLVDEIIVLDTGSEDNTVSIAESFGAKVHHMAWPGNFSAARNESLKKACGNWILYLDADEALDPNGHLDCIRKTASDPSVTAWSAPIRSYKWETEACDVTLNIRLFRNLPGLFFENEVHERIEPALARIGAKIAVAPFVIDHFGYRAAPEEMQKKFERNLLLSQKHLERDPDDPYCLYYIGAGHLSLKKAAESRQYLERALVSRNLPLLLEAMTCNLLAFAELMENRPDEALSLAQRSIELAPRQNTAYLVSGIALFRKAQFGAALPLLARSQKFLRLPPDLRQTDLSQEHAIIDEMEFYRLLGTCFSEIDRPREAVEHFRHFLELGGRDPEVARRAGVCCVNAGDFESGLKYLEKSESLGMARSELVLPMAYASAKLKDFTRAELLLKEAEKHALPDTDKIRQIRSLLESEHDTARRKYERKLDLLKEKLAENPDDCHARYHLGLTCMALEREEEARQAFDLALSCEGLPPSLEAMILNMKSYHHLRAGEIDPGLEAASRSLSVAPVQNTARLLKGIALFLKQAHVEALPILLQAYRFVSLPPGDRKSDISHEDSIDKIDLVEIIGACFAESGRFAEAIPFLKLSALLKPRPAVYRRLGVCLLNCGDFSAALEYLEKARDGAPEPDSLALPLAFACLKTGDQEAAARYFCSARPKDESEVLTAFQMIRAMAADNSFQPYLHGCIRSQEEAFRQAFPEPFLRFVSELGDPDFIPQTPETCGGVN